MVSSESFLSQLEQYEQQNNTVICGIPDDATDDNLEETVIKILADIDIVTEIGDIEACHRFGNSDRKKTRKLLFIFRKKALQESISKQKEAS